MPTRKKFFQIFLLQNLLHLLCPLYTADADGVALRSELQDLESLKVRVTAVQAGARWVLLHEQRGIEAGDWTIGCASPFLTFGPLARLGLLRELFNPLGYGAGSSVFTEEGALRLDSSFNPGSRRGVLLEPLPGRLGLFIFKSAEKPLKSGGFLLLPIYDSLKLSGIVLTSRPEDALSFEEWFRQQPPFPGGKLLHLGGRLDIKLSRWQLHLSTAASSGELVRPGIMAHLASSLKLNRILLDLLLGSCSQDYFNPDGAGPTRRLLAGGSLALSPWKPITLTGIYRKAFDQPSIYPDRFLGCTDEFGLEVESVIPLYGDLSLGLLAAGEKKISTANSGTVTDETELNFGLSLQGGHFALDLEWSRDFEDGLVVEDLLGAELKIGSEAVQGRLRCEQIREEERVYQISIRLDYSPEDYHLYFRMATEKPLRFDSAYREALMLEPLKYLTCTIGWEVKR